MKKTESKICKMQKEAPGNRGDVIGILSFYLLWHSEMSTSFVWR